MGMRIDTQPAPNFSGGPGVDAGVPSPAPQPTPQQVEQAQQRQQEVWVGGKRYLFDG